ncbi:MAG: trehalose-phosphatase [Myxococcales bacterium]|nr:trehalose-phosphatase [Myxococcales bacterium]
MRLADDRLCGELAGCDQLALLLDLDGTLIPFAPTTEAAQIDSEAVELLQKLLDAGVHVVVVSGRPKPLIEPFRRALDGVWWVAEHGSWRCGADRCWVGPPPAPELDELAESLRTLALAAGVRLERKSQALCIHWRLVAAEHKEALVSACELACEEWLESHDEFERLDGIEVLEVRRRSFHKGIAVSWVREHLPDARILAIGDDRTDEDMFAALRDNELAIRVGSAHTRARCWLPSHHAVRAFLGWLASARTNSAVPPFLSLESIRAQAPAESGLVVVSNRIPPAAPGRERPVGGLVSALEPVLRHHGGVWIGWNGAEAEGERPLLVHEIDGPVRASFELPPGTRDHYYGGFCNRALWPLFHGFPGRVRYTDDDWNAYVAANAEFARHAIGLVAPGGTVWVHDYHLLLVARELRERGFGGPIGLFLHVPFPHRDLFDTIPWADELIAALSRFDLIGVHTSQWAENLRSCAAARLPSRSMPEIAVLPIGVDPAPFRAVPATGSADVEGLRVALGDRRLILGVDRLDYAKGIPERLLGFERMLERWPEWRGKISFVQISVPSRAEVPEYAELRTRVETLVGRINGRFGEADWVPVRYLYRSYDHTTLAQLYRMADIGLVTPLRDGLNLVAKEFVHAQDPSRPGVLVLSRFAGAAEELCDAVITNPFHTDGVAADLDRALRMDGDERRRRHGLLCRAMAEKTPERWAAAFLDRLVSCRGRGTGLTG